MFKALISMILISVLTIGCAPQKPIKYIAIKSNPEELDYSKYTCEAEADAVKRRVTDSIKAATPDLEGGGFATGFANGMQGAFEGIDAKKSHYKACMARAGYRMVR